MRRRQYRAKSDVEHRVKCAAALGPPLTDRDETGGYQIATGLPGEPVPPTILSGAQTSRNS